MIENFCIKSSKNINIRGVLNIPETKRKKPPCIIYCHGFMGNRIEHNFMFVRIEKAVSGLGIASVRFDFSGSGESGGNFEDTTISSEIDDLQCVFKFIRSKNIIDVSNISVLGYSMGGAVSIAFSSKARKVIKSTILISPAVNIYNVLASGEFRNQSIIFESLKVKKSVLDDVSNYDFYSCAKHIKGAVLITHGTDDLSVKSEYSRKLYEKVTGNVYLKLIEGASHGYDTPESMSKLVGAICDFSKKEILKVQD